MAGGGGRRGKAGRGLSRRLQGEAPGFHARQAQQRAGAGHDAAPGGGARRAQRTLPLRQWQKIQALLPRQGRGTPASLVRSGGPDAGGIVRPAGNSLKPGTAEPHQPVRAGTFGPEKIPPELLGTYFRRLCGFNLFDRAAAAFEKLGYTEARHRFGRT